MGFDVSKDRFGYAGGFEAMSGGSDGGTDLTRFFIGEWRSEDIISTDGTAITSWPAHIGGVPLPAAAGTSPLYKIGITPSGKPVLRFDGIDDIMGVYYGALPKPIQHLFIVAAYRPASPLLAALWQTGIGAGIMQAADGNFYFTPNATILRDGIVTQAIALNGQFCIYEFWSTSPGGSSLIYISNHESGYPGPFDICYVAVFDRKVGNAAANALRTRLTNTYLAPQNLWQNLISYWKLDEASGAAIDARGTNDTLVLGAPGTITGKINGARHFVSTNGDALYVPANASMQSGDIDFTFCSWVNIDSFSLGVFLDILQKWIAAPNGEYSLGVNTSTKKFKFSVSPDGTAQVSVDSDVVAVLGTWYFIACWHDSVGNTINIQVNNGPVQSIAHSAGVFTSTAYFTIGAGVGLSSYLNGGVDEVGFWKKVLTPVERTWLYNNGSGRTYDDAQNFIQAAGITDATQQTAIKTLVTDLKTAGIWSKCQAIYPMVGGNATAHKFNLKDPRDLPAAFALTFVGGWVHSPTGALPDGATGSADTHFDGSVSGTLASSHLSVYVRTNTAAGAKYEIGSANNGGGLYWCMLARYTGDLFISQSYASANMNSANADARGFYIANRPSNVVQNQFKNGVKQGPDNATTMLTIPPGRNVTIGNTSEPLGFTDREIAFASIGTGLSDADAAAFNTAVQKFQTTLGRKVEAVLHKVDVGRDTGGTVSGWEQDDFETIQAGNPATATQTWDVSALTYPAPNAVYNSVRYAAAAVFGEMFTGLTPGGRYIAYVQSGWYGTNFAFDVIINGVTVDRLSFTTPIDDLKLKEGRYVVNADGSGNITIQCLSVVTFALANAIVLAQ